MNTAEHPRPYWHSDLKWICALLFLFLFTLTLLSYTLFTITRREVAIPAASAIVTGVFTKVGGEEENPADVEKQLNEWKAQPGDSIEPIPGQPVRLTKTELNTLTSEQIKQTIFQRLAESYYDLGVQGVADQQNVDQAAKDSLARKAGVLNYFNAETHKILQAFFLVLALLSLLALIGLIYFSYRTGRFVSPGLVLFVPALPGAVLTGLVLATAKSGGSPSPYLPADTARDIAAALFPGFAIPCAIGLLLLIIAIIYALIGRSHREKTA